MTYEDLPERWKDVLKKKYKVPLSADFFDDSATVYLESDDSCKLTFKYAKTLQSNTEMLVLTEHFGYHIFSLNALACWKYR